MKLFWGFLKELRKGIFNRTTVSADAYTCKLNEAYKLETVEFIFFIGII